jgi:hypothetical protein
MKNTGIWIDKNKALVVTLEKGKESLNQVVSKVDHFNPNGGSGTNAKGGPQDVVHDSKYDAREKQQLKDYFKEVVAQVSDSERLVIFGPAGTNEKLSKEIHTHYKDLGPKILAVEKADSMSDNQVKAWVRSFFSVYEER